MPTIKEKTIFNYNGIWSDTFGLINVNLDNDMFDEILIANREIIEVQTRGSERPFHQGFRNEPIEFEMVIAFEDGFTKDKISDVINWLFVDYYKPLYFLGSEDKIFYCMPVGDSRIVHNGLSQGYFTINMRCNSPFVYSPVILSEKYDLSNGISKTIELMNLGYGNIYPEISIQKIGNGNVSIQNLSDEGIFWEIRDLANLENVYINCEKEIIESDVIGLSRYGNVSGRNFPRLIYGKNVITISGKCYIQFRYRYRYRF